MNILNLSYEVKSSTLTKKRYVFMAIEDDTIADALLEIFKQIKNDNIVLNDVFLCWDFDDRKFIVKEVKE